MITIKALLTGFSVVSLCMANISGIVTDTGTTPIAGVVVQIDKSGQSAITGSDGRFTLVITPESIISGNSTLLQRDLSVKITGNMLNITIEKRAAVEVGIFDLCGKAVSAVCRIMDAGSHTLSLPNCGTGIYLYKVKVGNREIALKGNSIIRTSPGDFLMSNGLSSNASVKQAKASEVTGNHITAIKEGKLNYRCVIGNNDTSGVIIKMIENAGDLKDVDENVYQTVRIGNQVWMTENLRVTKYNDGTTIPLITDSASWSGLTTPAYCFYDNSNDSNNTKKYGALYNWYVVSPINSKKIAPNGWHVPTDAEWDTLENYLIANGFSWDGTTDGNNIAKSIAAKTDWSKASVKGAIGDDMIKNNNSGFSALPGGRRSDNGSFRYQSNSGGWWSTTDANATYAWNRYLIYNYDYLGKEISYNKSCGCSIRLLRD